MLIYCHKFYASLAHTHTGTQYVVARCAYEKQIEALY